MQDVSLFFPKKVYLYMQDPKFPTQILKKQQHISLSLLRKPQNASFRKPASTSCCRVFSEFGHTPPGKTTQLVNFLLFQTYEMTGSLDTGL